MKNEFDLNLVKQASLKFKKHLELPNNERIIFSGKFGLGKTVFLESFFKKEKKDYFVVKLFPVNYSIASNEDIFRYIKYDILNQLISNQLFTFKEFNFTKWEAMPFFIQSELKSFVKSFFRVTTKISSFNYPGSDKIYKELEVLYDKLVKYQKEINETSHDATKSFLNLLTDKEGSLYEFNLITETIIESLEKIQIKEKVLIIEDLDRIDPEHIFRLLNVFAAHTDYKNEGNKFGFDKVIFVCDVENIKNIFESKYGVKTDFSGYIDKFYSQKIYYFNNKADLSYALEDYVNSFNIEGLENEEFSELKNIIRHELFLLLSAMIDQNKYNLRTILKSSVHNHNNRLLEFSNGHVENSNKYISVIVIDILLHLIGDKNELICKLESLVNIDDTEIQLNISKQKHIAVLNYVSRHKNIEGHFVTAESNHFGGHFYLTQYSPSFNYAEYSIKRGANTTMHVETLLKAKRKLNFFQMYADGIRILDQRALI